jgi:hypothetical protein
MSELLDRLYKAVNEVKELGLNCETDLWDAIAEIERLTAAIQNRDRDWILAMGDALGLDSGFSVPIIPETAPFKKLFADITERLTAEREQARAGRDALAKVCATRARQLTAMTKWLDENQPDVWRRGIWDVLNAAIAAQEQP